LRARDRGADLRFAVFGPVWDTPSKRALGTPVGLAALTDAATLGMPLLALGGVTPARVPACRAAGAFGVAGIRAICSADDPAAAVGALLAGL
ncbi:MAG: thiamine-phosphate diphosphorylase, partial [Myxococcales bacterium]|nr:thiamine-phosphate diphosphorylase [Myxococcales bacterium]